MNRQQRRSLKSRQKRMGGGLSNGPGAEAPDSVDSVDVVMRGAVELHRAGRLDEALAQYDEVLGLYPKHVDALSNSAAIASAEPVIAPRIWNIVVSSKNVFYFYCPPINKLCIFLCEQGKFVQPVLQSKPRQTRPYRCTATIR